MSGRTRFKKHISCLMTFMMVLMVVPFQSVYAAMVGTETLLTNELAEDARIKILVFLERQDVQATMVARGVDPLEAKARVGSLSDAEIRQIADKIDQLPAGGSTVGIVVGAILLVFFVLLITDLLGLTDVFPFVRKKN